MLFDGALDSIKKIFEKYKEKLSLDANRDNYYVNRDLRGRIAIVWSSDSLDQVRETAGDALQEMCTEIAKELSPHALTADDLLIPEDAPILANTKGAVVYTYGNDPAFTVVDRMLTESSWSQRAKEDELSSRTVVFFSVKGGVGRSTALAAAAWNMAKKGKTVMVVDMDLESPGLSTSLLPENNQPNYGLLDWLVEDVVDNGDEVLQQIFAYSPLADDSKGRIIVIPAHGRKGGDYISKMGRAWMPRINDNERISWPQRLRILLSKLDKQFKPDYIFIDARSGLDEIASACVLDLAPRLVLLFALAGRQTWSGYSMLFEHWNRVGQAQNIRASLQVVAAMIPPFEDKRPYLKKLRENAWDCFRDHLYDDVEAEESEAFSFDCEDEEAPHNPWVIHWHQGLQAMLQLNTLEDTLDENQIRATFPFLENLSEMLPR